MSIFLIEHDVLEDLDRECSTRRFFCPKNYQKSQISFIFAMSIGTRKPEWDRWDRHIYITGVTVRFGFDVLELRTFKPLVKNKATGTPL